MKALNEPEFSSLVRKTSSLATKEHLTAAHAPAFVSEMLAMFDAAKMRNDNIEIDPRTVISPATGDAVLHAVGAVIDAVDDVCSGKARNAFCAVRPPGHHAEKALAMNYCFFNNVAVGAVHAVRKHGLERVAVVDFDAHHGNGTQDIFWDNPNLFLVSSHHNELFPEGCGFVTETGRYNNIVNMPLPYQTVSSDFRAEYKRIGLPRLREWAPQLILVSAGFDGHADDPLGGLWLQDDDYEWLMSELMGVAEEYCGGRGLVVSLEGGYNPKVLGRCTAATVRILQRGDKNATEDKSGGDTANQS